VNEITRVGAQGEGRQFVHVGVNLAKRVIRVHAVGTAGWVVISRALARVKFVAWCAPLRSCHLVVVEVGSSAHQSARRRLSEGLVRRWCLAAKCVW
jgi:transposase